MSDDYDIGYKKPPRYSRFKLGQSGNPKGRSKRPKLNPKQNARAMLMALLQEPVTVREGDKQRTMPQLELMFRTSVHEAIKGNPRKLKQVIELFQMLGQFAPEDDGIQRSGVLVVPARLSEEEWEAMYAKPRPDSVEQIEKEPEKK